MRKNKPFERYEGIDQDAKRQDVHVGYIARTILNQALYYTQPSWMSYCL